MYINKFRDPINFNNIINMHKIYVLQVGIYYKKVNIWNGNREKRYVHKLIFVNLICCNYPISG